MSGRHGADHWVLLPPVDIVARLVSGPAPQIPLASIAHLLRPHRDADGGIVDWTLQVTGPAEPDALIAFRSWRSTWRQEWPIGPVSNLVSLRREIDEIDHGLPRVLAGLLDRVVLSGGTGVPVTASAADDLSRELETVRLALSVDDRTGWGIVDDMPALTRGHGLARTWAPPPEELLLAGTSVMTVGLHPDDGLVAVHHGPEHITTVSGVAAVDLRNDRALVLDGRGSSVRLPLDDCRPLGWLVPRSLRWHVRSVPIVAVWSPLFSGLREALQAVATTGGWVELTAGAVVA